MRDLIRNKIVDSLATLPPDLTRRDVLLPQVPSKAVAVIGPRRAGNTTPTQKRHRPQRGKLGNLGNVPCNITQATYSSSAKSVSLACFLWHVFGMFSMVLVYAYIAVTGGAVSGRSIRWHDTQSSQRRSPSRLGEKSRESKTGATKRPPPKYACPRPPQGATQSRVSL